MSHDEVSPGGEKSGEDNEVSREAHIPRQSRLVVQAQEWSWTWPALPELWRVQRSGVIVGQWSIV